ncbi:MAG: ribonuclease P protein component [Opitutaceae bacterium]
MRLRPEQHLRSQGDFRRAREQGRRYQCDAFTFWWWQNPDSTAVLRRVGVVASTAAVGIAVQRNRAKRRLRELFRRHQEQLPAGGDLVIVARRALNRLPFTVLEERFNAICRQLPAPSHA